LKQCPSVADAHPDHIGFLHTLTNDPGFPQQWALRNSGQLMEGVAGTSGADIGVSKAWSFTFGTPESVIAVLDTGISLSHPDLANQYIPGNNVVRVGQTWDDGSSNSHGTYCSGIIAAATNNGAGIAGVAPNCKVLPIKVFSGIWGSESSVAAGLAYITGLRSSGTTRVDVANMSLGFPTVGSAFIDAVNNAVNAGIVVVASTGNAPGDAVGYPARLSNVIAVGATDNRDAAAVFQTTGPEMDLSAPGVSIWTTTDVGTNPNSYSFQSGTSMAAPFVSATAGLMRSVNPALTVAQVRQLLMDSAKDLGAAGVDPIFGAGRLNTGAAVQRALLSTGTCVADWNNDTVYDDADLFAFLDAWFEDNADVDGNGITDSVDLFNFLNAWFYGC
jgi:subtilisin family serine protease